MTGPTDPLSNTAEAPSAANVYPGQPIAGAGAEAEAALSIGPLTDAGTLDSESEAGDSRSISSFSNFSIDLSVCMNDIGLHLPELTASARWTMMTGTTAALARNSGRELLHRRCVQAVVTDIPGVIRSPSNVSVSSSLYKFVSENGRTFHRYKEGSELAP